MALPTNLPPPNSIYPSFNNALELQRKLGIRNSIETLKTLENVEGKGKGKELKVKLNPCVCKHDLVRKLDLSHLCFSLNFYFLMFLS